MEVKEMKVRVLRAFYYKGTVLPVNSEPSLPSVFAREMMAAKKAEPVLIEAQKQQPPDSFGLQPDAPSKPVQPKGKADDVK